MVYTDKESEFSIVNIWLGICVPLLIFNVILNILCDIFNNLCIVFAIIMLMLWVNIFMIVCKEMRIWAKVV